MTDLEGRLHDASPRYPFPPTPDISSAIVQRLPARRRAGLRLVIALAAALVALAALLGLSKGARSAVLDILDAVPGVRIERVEELPASTLLPDVDFGRPMTLAQAKRRASFDVRLPAELGRPERVYFDRSPGGGTVVTLRYDRTAILTEWQTAAVLFYKHVELDTRAELARFDGKLGVWIEGGDHAVFYLANEATERSIPGRLAGNVLIWQDEDRGYRLEADISRSRALEIARSLTP